MRALQTVPTGAGGRRMLCGPERAEMDARAPGAAPSSGAGGAGVVSRREGGGKWGLSAEEGSWDSVPV